MKGFETMEYKILISGFGGQGVLFLGKVIAQAAMYSGYEASWLPSYGPEMRGGTANCRVVISDEEISSPAFNRSDAVIAMNLPSLHKFASAADGIIITDEKFAAEEEVNTKLIGVNTSLAVSGAKYENLTNMIMLGALMNNTDVLSFRAVSEGIKTVAGEKHARRDIEAAEYGYKNFAE